MTVKAAWDEGLQEEVDFWRAVLGNTNPAWADYHRETVERLDPERKFDDHLASLLPQGVPATRCKVLDVAAGPVSPCGWMIGAEKVDLTPIDALAGPYRILLEERGFTPPVWTQDCHGEQIDQRFAANTFDVTHIRNALDHCYDPLAVIRNMLAVTKRGGWVVVVGFVDEAEYGMYDGLHQWNVRVEEGDLVIWRPSERHEVGKALDGQLSEKRCRQWDSDRWMSASLRKA
jgi:SAM-dependent methyltransferase